MKWHCNLEKYFRPGRGCHELKNKIVLRMLNKMMVAGPPHWLMSVVNRKKKALMGVHTRRIKNSKLSSFLFKT